MRLASFASAIADTPERRAAYLERKERTRLENERWEREREAQKARYESKPDPLIVALHKQVDSLGLSDDVLESFKALPNGEQRQLFDTMGGEFKSAIPVYLQIEPLMRKQALKVAAYPSVTLFGRNPPPFAMRLKMFISR